MIRKDSLHQLITGYEFWMVSHLWSQSPAPKVWFLLQIPNPCLRKQLGFYRKESEHAKIVLRCPKSEHDVTLKSPLNQTLLANRSTMDSNRSTIFTDSKSLQNAVKSDYDAENRSTISCFLKHFKWVFYSF